MLNKLILWALLPFLCGLNIAFAQTYGVVETTPGSLVNLEFSTPFEFAPVSGFISIRVRINNEYSFKQIWSLTSTSRVSGKSFMHYSKNLQVPGKSQRHFELAIPIGLVHDNTLYGYHAIKIAGPGIKSAKLNVSSYGSETQPILSKDLYELLRSEIEERNAKTRGKKEVLKLNLEQIPRSWVALTGYGSIAITANEFDDLKTESKNTLLDWTATGGTLIIAHEDKPLALRMPLSEPGPYGFGLIIHQWMNAFTLDSYLTNNRDNKHTLAVYSATKDITNLAPPPADTWPARLLVICYFISVTLVSLKLKRGTTPCMRVSVPILLSLLFSGILAVSLAVMAGFHARGSLNTVALIHQGRSHILQHRVMRSGIIINRAFQNANNSFIVPIQLPETDETSIYKQSFHVEDSWLFGDWLRSGQLSHSLEFQNTPLARTLFVEPGPQPRAYSRLPTTLPVMLYRQNGDNCFIAHKIESGKPRTLEQVSCAPSDLIKAIPESERTDISQLTWLIDIFLKQKNTFLALAKSSEQERDTLIPFAHWQKHTTVILGLGNTKDEL